jgi:hypothetical protein
MNAENFLGLMLRLLPALIMVALAFAAASDPKTRQQWTDLLYGAGALRPEQRSDAKVQGGVRLPFLIIAVALLIWPIQYYRHVTRVIEVKSNVFTRVSPPKFPVADNSVTAGNTVTGSQSAAPDASATPGATAPQAPAVDMFGRPVQPGPPSAQ